MFAVIFFIIVLELVASMGAFGALAAQNLFTNSAAGWYIRLDWTAVYAYAVTLLSTLVTLSLAIAALARNASRSGRTCNVFFSPGSLFVLGFLFSVLWVVIAGFAYRNPLPMRYPCDIFRHLRGSLEMLGLASGKSLIEEGGLLVGICQSSKAFLALAGIGLGLWVLLFVLSCAAMVTGLNPPRKAQAATSTSKSLRSYISGLSQKRNGAKNPHLSVSYMESGNAKNTGNHQPNSSHGHTGVPIPDAGYNNAYTVPTRDVQTKYAPVPPTSGCQKCNNAGQTSVLRRPSGRYASHIQHHHQRTTSTGHHPISKTPQLVAPPPPVRSNSDGGRYDRLRDQPKQSNGLPDPMSAFVTDGYSRYISPRLTGVPKDSPPTVHRVYDAHQRAIEDLDRVESASAIGDAQHKGISAADDIVSHPHFHPDDSHSYSGEYAPHHQEHPYHKCTHSDNEHSPPNSQGSRKQRLRQLFGKDPDTSER